MIINCVDNITKLPEEIKDIVKDTSVFLSEDYGDLVRKQSGKILYLFSNNYIIPIQIFKKYLFKRAELISEYSYINQEKSESEKEFLDSCMDYLKKKLKVHFISCTPVYALFNNYPTNSIRIPFGSHIIDLSKSEEDLLNKMKPSCRQSIKTAQNYELIVKHGGLELLDDYLKIDKETWERSNINTDHSQYYKDLIRTLPKNSVIFMTYKGEEAQGGAIYLYDKYYSYNLYGARKNNSVNGSNNIIHWEAIKFMKEKGVQFYSFVGARINVDKNSKFHGIQKFKESFGSELKESFMFKVVFNKFMYKLYNKLISLKSGKEFKDIIDQEIDKWQDLNK